MMTKSRFMENLARQEKMHHLESMVANIDREFPLQDIVKEAMLSVDRELFVPQIFKHLSYSLDALPMQEEQWISSPLTVAKMTQYLEPSGSGRVLEIGCGSGYQAAVLSKVFDRVFTIERIESLLSEARARFKELRIMNINTKFDDGNRGWDAFAPFDRILYSASPETIPDTIFEQLAEGGILVAPVNSQGLQMITRFYKRNGKVTEELIEQCEFVPVVNGTLVK